LNFRIAGAVDVLIWKRNWVPSARDSPDALPADTPLALNSIGADAFAVSARNDPPTV